MNNETGASQTDVLRGAPDASRQRGRGQKKLIHAWRGPGQPKSGPVYADPDFTYTTVRLYQHTCGIVAAFDSAELAGHWICQGCRKNPGASNWGALYRLATSYQGGAR